MMLLLLSSLAFAQEIEAIPDEPVKVEEGKTITAIQPSWMVPYWMWDQALATGVKLRACQQGLNEVAELAPPTLDQCSKSLDLALQRHDTDEAALARFMAANAALQTDVQKMKWQRNAALGIAGGLAIGVVATGAIAWRASK